MVLVVQRVNSATFFPAVEFQRPMKTVVRFYNGIIIGHNSNSSDSYAITCVHTVHTLILHAVQKYKSMSSAWVRGRI